MVTSPDTERGPLPRLPLLYRLGDLVARRPLRTLTAWLLVLAVSLVLAASLGGEPRDEFTVEGAPSQIGSDLLASAFPVMSGADARVVVHADSGQRVDGRVLAEVGRSLADLPHVGVVDPPRLSPDADTALFSVQYEVPVTDFEGDEGLTALEAASAAATEAGLQVEYGGQVPEMATEISGTAEVVGFGVALLVLLLAFSSFVAAGLPLLTALVGLGVGMSAVGVLAAVTPVSATAPTVASMVGIGVGIDYALLLMTRFTEHLRSGLDARRAAATTTATAGMSVVFAGATVVVSLLGLRFVGLPTYASVGLTTGLVVAAAVLTSVTLVPALCVLLGPRLLGRLPRGRHRAPRGPSATARWAARVGRRPLPWVLGALTVLVTLALPVLDMRTWPEDAGSQPTDYTFRRAYDLVAAEYGAGANGPLLVALDLKRMHAAAVRDLPEQIAATPGVVAVSPVRSAPSGAAAVLVAEPAWGPQDERASALVDRLRADVLPDGAYLTGRTAVFVDITDLLAERLWTVVGFVVSVSVVLLTLVFRSLVVPVKAALMNLLSIGAAYGVVTAVFQWGWGAELLGVTDPVPVSSWLPVLMFAILFGLSMDYEVFLLSRVRESWLATGDPRGSVVDGLAATGRVISIAATIMVAVFLGFAFETDLTVKMVGVGMAAAVLIDATLVRLVLVPGTMALLGAWNWWLPSRVDRMLPTVEIEGSLAGVGR